MRNPFYSVYRAIIEWCPSVRWRKKRLLTAEQKDQIVAKLSTGYYVILVGERGHLSSLLVQIATLVKTGKWSHYSHVLINCDFAETRDKFKFVEATAVGVHFSTFDDVFNNCDYVCLLTPIKVSNDEWTKIIDSAVKQNGLPYDDLFDLSNAEKVSCVELVLNALKASEQYADDFAELEKMIREVDNLLPAMYRDCADFKVEYQI